MGRAVRRGEERGVGRRAKRVFTEEGLDRRATGYYATPPFVARFLAREMLRLRPDGAAVFDPCVGREELLAPWAEAGKRLVAQDVLDHGVHRLARFERRDFFDFYAERVGRAPLPFDYLVANPPYNCHEAESVKARRPALQRLFGEVGTLNTCAMFLAALIDLARPGALIGVVALDSLLWARGHGALRRKLLESCTVHVVVLCPSDLFRDQGADVRSCLLVLEKGRDRQRAVRVLNRPADAAELERALARDALDEVSLVDLLLPARDDLALAVGLPRAVRRAFDGPRLGDAFLCVTGISTGDDRAHVARRPTAGHAVPFYKNPASRRFFAEPDGYLAGDLVSRRRRVPGFIVRHGDLIARAGISCTSMGVTFGACRKPAGGAFGVNPNVFADPADDAWWLLAYLNSRPVSLAVRGALARTNMITSGYAARIPLVPLDAASRRRLGALARAAHAGGAQPAIDAAVDAADEAVFAALDADEETRREVTRFCAQIARLA